MQSLTPYQNKYIAWLLDRHLSTTDDDKFTGVLAEAKVDLNPHQIEAALFAFHSPLDIGAILADEVGLGKTIEAALVISQQWAEHRRHILVITPATLRKQWSMELEDKFYLPSLILETKSFNRILSEEYTNPFDTDKDIIICSYQFAKKQMSHIDRVDWDLVICDEAHKLRNVYKTTNKTSIVLKNGLSRYKKLLLTATPLQNNVRELYGLISIIDDNFFGSLKSFSDQYSKTDLKDKSVYNELRERIKPIIHRTLRSQVQEYVKYTERKPFVQEYYPSEDEITLSEMVREYLQRENSFGLPKSQRQLITLVLYKLLSSSSFAIAGTLKTIIERLQKIVDDNSVVDNTEALLLDNLENDVDSLDDYDDEWNEDEEDKEEGLEEKTSYTAEDIKNINEEIADLVKIYELAHGIAENSKGECLVKALEVAFADKRKHGQPEKALIFTESNRTQQYIKQLLEANGYAGKIVLFNGSNSDASSKEIYAAWKKRYEGTSRITSSLTADKRQAIVDYFRDNAQIMIATEAAAEGINLQFCSLVVNFDMPWNPQRVEQRIGRCHRYGQKNDVVVINFINKANRADQRVYELLDEKYNLFKGVFGSSDEVIGSTMDGIDFEHRVLDIYQSCRSTDEIDKAFDSLQNEMKNEIEQTLQESQSRLIENFDQDVVQKLRIRKESAAESLSRYQSLLWILTLSVIGNNIKQINNEEYSFRLKSLPAFANNSIRTGKYRMGKDVDDALIFRIGHPLAQQILSYSKKTNTSARDCVTFNYSSEKGKISIIEAQKGKYGYLSAQVVHYQSQKEQEDYIISTAVDCEGNVLENDFTEKLMTIDATSAGINGSIRFISELDKSNEVKRISLTERLTSRNKKFIDDEVLKIERWADDQTYSAELELKNIKKAIKEKNRLLRNANSEELEHLKRDIESLTRQQRVKRNEIFRIEDEIDLRRQKLIKDIENSLNQQVTTEELFMIKWIIA